MAPEVSYKLKFSGTFSDSLDLERLPYDRQLLRIQVSRGDMGELRVAPAR